MAYNSYFINSTATNRAINPEQTNALPNLSTQLDSIRTYQFEVTFHEIQELVNAAGVTTGGVARSLTLACKAVSEISMEVATIEASRLNDKFYYPGKPTVKEVTFTFDNIKNTNAGAALYAWMQSIYDPLSGTFQSGNAAGKFKTTIDVVEVDSKGNAVSYTRLIGCFPKSWQEATRDYAGSEGFHTLQLVVSVDLIYKSAVGP